MVNSREHTPTWHSYTKSSTLKMEWVSARNALSDAARDGKWPQVFELIQAVMADANAWKLDDPGWYTPLHWAAEQNASLEIARTLVDLGAWRTLTNGVGETAQEIAAHKGFQALVEILKPDVHHVIAPETIQRLEEHLHVVILERAGALIREHELRLPPISILAEMSTPKIWFPVPGMYGGFSIWLQRSGGEPNVMAESWCRVVGGSGRRHEITQEGYSLVWDESKDPDYLNPSRK